MQRVIADGSANVSATRNLTLSSAENYARLDHYKEVKKSGIFSAGGGLGFTIGTQQTKTTQGSDGLTRQGTNIAALGGNVSVSAGENAHISSSNILADKDANISAKETIIDGKSNIYRESITQESKTTGLTVSFSHGLLDLGQSLYAPISRIGEVQDDRLKAAYALQARRLIREKFGKGKNPLKGQTFSLDISFGTSKSYSRMENTTTEYAGSRIAAGGNTNVTAGERDLTVKGSTVIGNNVSLTAKGNVRLEAGENTSITTTENKFSSASIGASFAPSGLTDISISANKGNGNSKESVTSYSPALVSAKNNLSLTSSKDVDILGSKAQGEKITAKVGGNLNIETLQEKETYEEQNKSAGFGVSWNVNFFDKTTDKLVAPGSKNAYRKFSMPNIGGSFSKGNVDSHYRSARDQAGFFAGSKGFDIYVEKNTDLKGGVIASNATPDKNHLSTGTLSFSDLKNEADYSAKSIGASYHKYGNYKNMTEDEQNKVYNTIGLAPSLSMPVKGDASSTTKSAVAAGTIDIRENKAQDISALSRDTANSLNELGKIFDKAKIEEQQELAAVFGEEAFRLAHNLKDDGSGRKIAIHIAIGGIMSAITGAGFASGAIGAGLNEALINNLKGLDPGTAQIVSGIIGAAAAKAIGGNAQAGASAAASGTKYNIFAALIPRLPQMAKIVERAATNLDKVLIHTAYSITTLEGVQIIQKKGTNEVVARLEHDGVWLFHQVDSTLESILQNLHISYAQPYSNSGIYYYFLPTIIVTPPDHVRFPFDLSPNILDIKYKPRTNPLLDFKEQWSSQDFSDGNRFFSQGVEKEKADKAYPPANEHSSTNNPKDLERTGKPNSSIDRVDEKGRIITRRWYDGNGRAKKDVDFTDHGNPKTHPEVPHEHTWEWDKNGHSNRK